MKKFIKSLFLFASFSIVLYPLLIIVWGNYAPDPLQKNLHNQLGATGHMCSRIQNITDIKDVDILFLGSSHTYSSFDPRIFKQYGLSTFNLGSSAQSHIQTEVLLKRYLDEINPKLIIYEVFPGVFELDGVESALDIIANDRNDLESIKMAFTQNHIKVYNALIYGFYRDVARKTIDCKDELLREDETYIAGGFVETKLQYFEPMKFIGSRWHLQDRWYFQDKQFEFFERALLLIEQRNIPVILVQAPVTQVMYKSFSNNSEFDDRMREYGVYYNFNELLELNDELHFHDEDHLNQTGVKIFNTELIEILLGKE